MDKILKRDLKIFMGDFNVKVGVDNINRELIMGRYGIGEQNKNREFFIEFDLVIGGIIFFYKIIWIFFDGKIVNQIDYIIIR